MKIPIRNMVCARCINAVEQIFREAGLAVSDVSLGSVSVEGDIDSATEALIRARLIQEGFEWLDDQKMQIVEQIKREIIQLVQTGDLTEMKEKLSVYLSSRLLKDYQLLSNLFSSQENTTIEQFFILQKIEKVKEWLAYNELTLGEMAFQLGYSSVAHLSGQFKKITGFTPSEFRRLKEHPRRSLDSVK